MRIAKSLQENETNKILWVFEIQLDDSHFENQTSC